MTTDWKREAIGLAGAAAGGLLGFLAFGLLWRRGFYAMMIPGAALGLGGGLAAGIPSTPRGLALGAAALALALVTEWHYRPFAADGSPGYFLAHLHELSGVTLLMIGVGGVLAYWLGRDPVRRW